MRSRMYAFHQAMLPLKLFGQSIANWFRQAESNLAKVSEYFTKVQRWLKRVEEQCSEMALTPYWKCRFAFRDAYRECLVQVGHIWFIGSFCSLVRDIDFACEVARILDFFCTFPPKVKEYWRIM